MSSAHPEFQSSFRTEMEKKIRNKTKKLQQIKELDDKVKIGEVKPNEEQKHKIKTKKALDDEVNDMKV